MNMRKLLTAAVLATSIAAFAGPAFANPMPMVYGSIDVSGGSTGITTTMNGVTTINFSNPANIFSVSGAFDELMTSTSVPSVICSSCVTLGTPFSNTSSLPFQLFTGMSNNDGVALSVTSDTFNALGGGGYEIFGTGNVSLTGYTTTLGSFSMTIPATGNGASVDIFTQTPEPGTLAMFGAGLLGCAFFVGRRRRGAKFQG